MNCKDCQPLFSDFVEKALLPIVHEGVAAHLSACPVCRKELRDFQRALQSLRSLKLEAPPPGLKESILARIEEASEEEADSPPQRSRRPAPPMDARSALATRLPWAAAAALLLAAATWIAVTRERSWNERVSALESELSGKLEASSRDKSRLVDELQKAFAAAAESRRSANDGLAAEETRRQAAERRTASLEERIRVIEEESRRRESDAARLEKDLAAAHGEASRLERELSAAQKAASRPDQVAVREEARDGGPTGEKPSEGEAAGQESPHRTHGVVFKSRGGRLELSVRGPREEVIPELFAIARDDASAETADLALNALENLIEAPKRDAAESPPRRGWLDRRLEGFADVLGMAGSASEPATSAETDRAARLKALEDAWRATK